MPRPVSSSSRASSRIVTATSHDSDDGRTYSVDFKIDEACKEGGFSSLAYTWPRTYNTVLFVVAPFLFLILLSFFCGHFVALLEYKTEIEANDESLKSRLLLLGEIFVFGDTAQSLPLNCLNGFIVDTLEREPAKIHNFTHLKLHMTDCGTDFNATSTEFFDKIYADLILNGNIAVGTSFNWITCRRNSTGSRRHKDQANFILEELNSDIEGVFAEEVKALGLESAEELTNSTLKGVLFDNAVAEATGGKRCKVNTAAGAWFWFTIMSTIGYGNVAPVTPGGRGFVYSFGFICVLVFTVLVGNAGYVLIHLFDDFIRNTRCRFLDKPFSMAIFWLLMYYAWMFVIAHAAIGYRETRTGNDFELNNAFWFAYISTTSVGLGDFYFGHEVIQVGDMFSLTTLMLIGFVLLANFLLKLSHALISLLDLDGPTLSEILEASRRRMHDSRLHEQEKAVHETSVTQIQSTAAPVQED